MVAQMVEALRYKSEGRGFDSGYTPGLDNETTVPAAAASVTPGDVMDTGPNGVVQN